MTSPKQPGQLLIVILGDPEVSETLSRQFDTVERPDKPVHVPSRDAPHRLIRTGENETEILIELWDRGGYDTHGIVNFYCSRGQAFIIAFSMNSKKTFDAIRKFKSAIEQAGRGQCPQTLVGMYNPSRQVEVTEQDAKELATELKLGYFIVQTTSFDQVMAPFFHLCRRQSQQTESDMLDIQPPAG
ncbi:uncharacterized protein PV07_04719 [Cladophialophora immunda]|uniref:Uncharacterized protein n=1 Tax=Cladophialophora immunda TaxID=569365 RepID=A0A0D1ZLL5_9EURO|nr:uncharacterized protein PV07_04719 [Cladophialophora immunda]KIW28856.1 hypothetical protein PV07_04719 [Cladophialophora immunda]